MREEEEMTEQERRRRKYERRQRQYEHRLRRNHWRTRCLTESQKRIILGDNEKEEQENVGQEDRVETGMEARGVTELSTSPAFSCSIPRGSVGSDDSGSTWYVREGSDIFSPASRLSYHDRVDRSEKNNETVIEIEKD